jgi:hypothetical protein
MLPNPARSFEPLPDLRLRPARHARPLPRMWNRCEDEGMIRRLFTTVSALSLLMLVAIAALWVRCYWIRDTFEWLRQRNHNYTLVHWEISFARPGVISVEQWWQTFNSATGLGENYQRLAGLRVHEGNADQLSVVDIPPRSVRSCQLLGFCCDQTLDGSFFGTTGSGEVFLSVPYWLLLVTTGVLPSIWIRKRFHRNKCGRCRTCGYDLRATRDRCPECGTAIPATINA